MKINSLNIPEEGLNLQFSLAEDSFPGLISEKEKFAFALRRIDISASVRKVRRRVPSTTSARMPNSIVSSRTMITFIHGIDQKRDSPLRYGCDDQMIADLYFSNG